MTESERINKLIEARDLINKVRESFEPQPPTRCGECDSLLTGAGDVRGLTDSLFRAYRIVADAAILIGTSPVLMYPRTTRCCGVFLRSAQALCECGKQQ